MKITSNGKKTVKVSPKLSFSFIYRNGIARGGVEPKYKSPYERENNISEYFDSLTDDDGEVVSFPTITGLALALGFSSVDSLYDYERKAEFSYLVKRARTVCTNFYEMSLSTRQSPVGAIFALKNLGWRDTPMVSINAGDGPAGVVASELAWEGDEVDDAEIVEEDGEAKSEV